jgi:ATP-dependent Clp protease ATP-binding subunit ClpC
MSDARAAAERAESEIVSLRKRATELARERKERTTTVHLLAAMSALSGPVAELLAERHLSTEAILKAGRSFDEDDPSALGRALDDAREVAKRARGPVSTDGADRGAPRLSPDSRIVHVEPGGLHVLLALLADRRSRQLQQREVF